MFSSDMFRNIRDFFRTAEQQPTAHESEKEQAAAPQTRSCATSNHTIVRSKNKKQPKSCWFTTSPPCQFVVRLKQEFDSARTIRATTQKCPNPECKARIEKDGGCDVMKYICETQ
ncbi:ring finger protein [Apiospora hydei]|uniref:Ring finger protein n=1 Tax=Apiospora hydei TaxID=1337664 RepID=A0ABR1VHP5_9PEZI